jgi:peptidoglycan/LPS O-acetylase OafA/YrhL
MAENMNTGESRRMSDLPSLTGLRFVAALLVFFAHSSLLHNPLNLNVPINFFANQHVANAMAYVFAPSGYVGVSFFFVLSGFVLTWSRRAGDRPQAFWRRRLVKVFPNHIVTWGLAMWLFAGSYTPLRVWLPNLFLVHSYSWLPDTSTSVNVPAWSLCSELLFYLLFPFIIKPLSRIADRRLWLYAGLAVAGVAVIALLSRYVVPSGVSYPLAPLPLTKMWFAYLFPPARLFEFVVGILLARIVAAGRWPRIHVVWVVALALVGYAAAVVVPAPYNFSLTTVVPIAAIICTAASADAQGRRTPFSTPLMVWLGMVSFGFYMVQSIPIFYGRLTVFGGHTFSVPVAIACLLLLFAVTLLLGWLLHTCVEMPMMRRFGRARRRITPPTQVLEPAPGIAG